MRAGIGTDTGYSQSLASVNNAVGRPARLGGRTVMVIVHLAYNLRRAAVTARRQRSFRVIAPPTTN